MGAGLATFEQETEVAIGTGQVSGSNYLSNFATSTQVGDLVVVSSKNASKDSDGAVLNFNPSSSQAVCAGVPYSNRVPSKPNLGDATDKGPLRVSSVLRDTLGLPHGHVTTLSSQWPDHAATMPNIVALLSEAAGKVGEDGLLFFSFSGHGEVMTDANGRKSMILITADKSRPDTRNGLSTEALEYCLKDTKAKHVVIMLDCCYSGMMANSLAEGSIQTQAQLYVLAACSKDEITMWHEELESCFFAFFMTDYLKRHAKQGSLPISSVSRHTQTLCPEVASLCVRSKCELPQKSAGTKRSMNPTLRIRPPVSVRSGEENYSLDTVDSGPRMFASNSVLTEEFLWDFVTNTGSQRFYQVPKPISDWLSMVAMPAIRILYCHGYLSPSHSEYEKVLNMVVCLLSRTMGSMCVDSADGVAEDPDFFLVLVTYVQHAIVQPVDDEGQARVGANPDLEKPTILCSHALLGLRYYVVGTMKALDCDSERLPKLVELYRNMDRRLKRFQTPD